MTYPLRIAVVTINNRDKITNAKCAIPAEGIEIG